MTKPKVVTVGYDDSPRKVKLWLPRYFVDVNILKQLDIANFELLIRLDYKQWDKLRTSPLILRMYPTGGKSSAYLQIPHNYAFIGYEFFGEVLDTKAKLVSDSPKRWAKRLTNLRSEGSLARMVRKWIRNSNLD